MRHRPAVAALLATSALIGAQLTGAATAVAVPAGPALSLTQLAATETLGADHVVTATYTNGAASASGITIVFEVTAGNNAGTGGTCTPADCTTASDGDVNWTYTGFAQGADTVRAYADLDHSGTLDAGEPSATVDVTWQPGPPVATPDTVLTTVNTQAQANVLDNDTSGGTNALELTAPLTTITTTGGHVDAVCDSTGLCTVTPHAGFTGSEQFSYTASNGTASVQGTVTVNVYPPRKILVYGPTGSASGLAESTPGVIVDTWSAALWATKTTADFAAYDAIVFGDEPACFGDATQWQPALDNRSVWSAAVNGPVVVLGTDPDFHGKDQLVHQAVEFAAGGAAGKTGLYVALSCVYDDGAVAPETVDLLGGFGTFKVLPAGCNNAVHKVASHPTLNGLDDKYLSNWSCSTHELFTEFPPNFAPLAIAVTDTPPAAGVSLYHGSDGSTGLVYILASGATSIGLSLAPPSGLAGAGGSHSVTATLRDADGNPLQNHRIRFSVTAGPNTGVSGTCTPASCLSAADGTVQWSYTSGPTPGTDSIRAYDDANNSSTLDTGEGQATAGMTWAAVGANHPPVATDDTLDTTVDTQAALNVLSNDTDADADPLIVTTTTAQLSAHGGSATCTASGDCTYTPPAGYAGPDSFTYDISDGNGGTDTGTVNVTVHAVSATNSPPVAGDDAADTTIGTPVDVSVLDNDTDPDFDPLTVTAPVTSTRGSADKGAVLCSDLGICTYTPDAGKSGDDTFTYTISDGRGGTDTGVVTIHIATCPDLRSGLDAAAGLLTGFQWVACSAPDANAISTLGPPVMTPLNGSAALLTSGQAALASPPNNSGSAGRSNGNALRGGHDVSILELDLTVPTGNNCLRFDFEFGSEEYPEYVGQSFNDGFLAELDTNDWQIDNNNAGSPITAAHNFAKDGAGNIVSINSGFFSSGSVVTDNGLQYDGSTPLLRAQTPVTAGKHKLFLSIFDAGDGILDSGALVDRLATSTTTAGGCTAGVLENSPPVATADAVTTAEDTAKIFAASTLKTNDTDPDGDALTVTDVSATGSTLGTVGLSAGNVTYTPPPNFNGSDSFAYTISDGHGHETVGTVAVTVTPVNDAPVAVTDTKSTPEDTALTLAASDLTANDTDVDGDTLAVTGVTGAAGTHGSVALNTTTHQVTYTPAANYNGPASFTYALSDGHSGSATGTVNVTVTPVNDAPHAVDDVKSGAQNTDLAFPASELVVNDTDVEGDSLAVTAVSNPDHGTVSLSAGTITFTPDAGYCCAAGFDYTVSDGSLTDVGHVTVTLTSHPPTAVNDAMSVLTDQSGEIDVLANDTDQDGDALSVSAVTDPAHGYVWCLVDGHCSYESLPGYKGPDSFIYTASDGHGGTSTATVALTVRMPVHLDATVSGTAWTKVVAGTTITLKGTLQRLGSTAGVAGESIQVFSKPHSSGIWPVTPAVTLVTSATGIVSKTFTPTLNTDYKLVHAASPYVLDAESPVATTYATWHLVATVSPLSGLRLLNAAASVKGTVTPAKVGSIYLQHQSGTTWVLDGSAALTGTGGFTLPIAPRATTGTDRYRVVMPADADHDQNTYTFPVVTDNGPVAITSVTRVATTLNAETVVLRNLTAVTVHLGGYKLFSASTGRTFTLPVYSLPAAGSVTVHTGTGTNGTGHLYLRSATYIWRDTHDTARLSRPTGVISWRFTY